MPSQDRKLCLKLQKDSTAEVARQLGISPNTLRYRISRLRRWFRAQEEKNPKKLSLFPSQTR